MDEVIVLDGYNVIHAWGEMAERMHSLGLEAAREKLTDSMINYRASAGCEMIIVFDAHSAPNATAEPVLYSRGGVTEVYTAKDQTADSYIEAFVEKLKRADRHRVVRVVTGDALEQGTVLTFGAARMTVNELMQRVERIKCVNAAHMKKQTPIKRHELEQRLPRDIATALEELRRK